MTIRELYEWLTSHTDTILVDHGDWSIPISKDKFCDILWRAMDDGKGDEPTRFRIVEYGRGVTFMEVGK